ncbi:MAG: hypothetical protein BWY59_01233 [Verrucomicrobia bacterium ADurb.Bin345]|nr:MAG: hypothetical protein BWY59_01233 [Verrucomicrobia bacterium ADurb.Bin345]
MSTRSHVMLVALLMLVVCGAMAQAQVPPLLNYQGRVALNGTNFNGTGQFKFALGNTNLSVIYWHNSTSWDSPDWEPVTAVSLTVTRGLFSVLLGDTNLSNMAALSPTVFTNSQVWLRTWFDDGVSGAQRLMPDQRIVSAGYAMQAESVSLGAITTDMLDDDAVTGAKIADATITFANIAQGGASAGQALVWNGTAWSNAAAGTTLAGYDENGPFSTAPDASGSGAIAMGVSAKTEGDYGVIGGGSRNWIEEYSSFATIGGGDSNRIESSAAYSTIGGGKDSRICEGSFAATISGGFMNWVGADAYLATIGGGQGNRISADSRLATVSGGNDNSIATNSWYTTIIGGDGNSIGSNCHYATVLGGRGNCAAGIASVAFGRRAKATNDGAFVWGDSTDADVGSIANNSFTVRAYGGARFWTSGGVGPYLNAGSPDWISSSDCNLKENFRPVDTREVLERLSRVPITEWNFKTQAPEVRHLGPMAQDFHAAFGLGGSDDKGIGNLDASGVALAGIQGLYRENQELKAQLVATQERLEAMEKRIEAMGR